MRNQIYILIVMIFLFTGPAAASDVLLGTVVSTEPKKGEIVVRPAGVKPSGKEKDSKKHITVSVAPKNFPKHIRAGETVRVWGAFKKGGPKRFTANRITAGGFGKPKTDPTGVRSRLRHIRRPGHAPGRGGAHGPGPGHRPGPGGHGGHGPGRGGGG